jgi:hypothetical protein
MESEDFEQIPWASLVAEQEDGIDRRIYLAVGVVALLVIAVFGMRLVGGGTQPPSAESPIMATSTSSLQDVVPDIDPPTAMIIAEADLRVEEPVPLGNLDMLVSVTAEWFVTDWFTRDGSHETVQSIRAALAPELAAAEIPHEIESGPVTFVEWAKTVDFEVTTDGTEVTIVYRAIRKAEEGFVREPVRTVVLSVEYQGDLVVVSSLPSER